MQSQSVDAVLCLDLIEHVKEDYKVIQEIGRVLKKDGKCILTTPMDQGVSFPFMSNTKISEINFNWGHERLGYTKFNLRRLLLQSDLNIDETTGYFNSPTRFVYRTTLLSRIRYPFKSMIYRVATRLEQYLNHGTQEHIVIGRKLS